MRVKMGMCGLEAQERKASLNRRNRLHAEETFQGAEPPEASCPQD